MKQDMYSIDSSSLFLSGPRKHLKYSQQSHFLLFGEGSQSSSILVKLETVQN